MGTAKGRDEIEGLMEWAIVAVLVLLNLSLTVWFSLRLYTLIQNGLNDLDGNIAAAIKSLVEQGVGDFEPINPVQAASAQFITARMGDQENSTLTEIPRAIDGKFSER